MTAYTEPPTDQLARLAAEAMGPEYKLSACHLFHNPNPSLRWLGKVVSSNFAPEDCHNDAQILVDEAFKRGFGGAYSFHLVNIRLGYDFYPLDRQVIDNIHLLATPEQKTRAFLRAIHESNQ